MKKIFIIILLLMNYNSLNADETFSLTKIPNLKTYKIDSYNGLKYLIAKRPFQVGIRENNVTCFNSDKKNVEEKFNLLLKNFDIYNPNFLEKINLKYIVLCERLSVANIDAAGVPNFKMKTLILDINFDKKFFERVLHHEVFHMINDSFKEQFPEDEWIRFNPKEFKYAECSTCSNLYDLSIINETNGFITEYSMTTASEDMAEVFSFLMKVKIKLYEKSIKDPILKKKISFIKKNILIIYNNFNFGL